MVGFLSFLIMRTSPRIHSGSFLALLLAVATCITLSVVLLKNAIRMEAEVAFAAPTAVNTILNDLDLQIFLRVQGITGEASEDNHQNDILVDSYSFGASRSPAASTPTMQDFLVTMPANKASAKLMVYAAGSVNVPRVTLYVRRKGGTTDFLRWTLTDAFVSSYKTVGNLHGDGIQDQVGRVEWSGVFRLEWSGVWPTEPIYHRQSRPIFVRGAKWKISCKRKEKRLYRRGSRADCEPERRERRPVGHEDGPSIAGNCEAWCAGGGKYCGRR
jgi:type VI secretion system secreted protein Hcp